MRVHRPEQAIRHRDTAGELRPELPVPAVKPKTKRTKKEPKP